jgi:hypothetical protein
LLDVIGMLGIDEERHLVRPKSAPHLQTYYFRPRPTLG